MLTRYRLTWLNNGLDRLFKETGVFLRANDGKIEIVDTIEGFCKVVATIERFSDVKQHYEIEMKE